MATLSKIWVYPRKREMATAKLNGSLYYVEISQIFTYYVQYTDNTGTELEAMVASGTDGYGNSVAIPTINEYISGTTLCCKNIIVTRLTEDATIFEVQVEFNNSYQQTSTESGNWNVQISVSGVEYTEDVYNDKDGNPIVNSAGLFFDPTKQKTFYDELVKVKFASASIDQSNIATCRGCVNSSTCGFSLSLPGFSRSYPVRGVKLTEANYDSKIVAGETWWDVYYALLSRQQVSPVDGTSVGFIDFVLDKGYEQTSGTASVGDSAIPWSSAITQSGQLPVLAIPLNGSGQFLNQNISNKNYSSGGAAVPTYLPFKIESEQDFTSLLAAI